jgi:Ca2+/H+ antiporter, TMEM165/GDT1 family
MSSWLLPVTLFAVTFVSKLPDKSMFATLVLGTRYWAGHVWLGVAAAFAVHVTLSVVAGGLLTLAPKSVIDFVSAALFLGGGVWMLRSASEDDNEPGPDAARLGAPPPELPAGVCHRLYGRVHRRMGGRHPDHDGQLRGPLPRPFIIGAGALAALWSVSALAVFGGSKRLERVPMHWVRLVGAVALTGLGIYSLMRATASLS